MESLFIFPASSSSGDLGDTLYWRDASCQPSLAFLAISLCLSWMGKFCFRTPIPLVDTPGFSPDLRARQGGLGFRSMLASLGRCPDSSPIVRSKRSYYVLDSQPFGLTDFLLFKEKTLSSFDKCSYEYSYFCFLFFGLATEQEPLLPLYMVGWWI